MNELDSHPQGKTQLQMIKKHLEVEKQITTWTAIQLYGITRLSQYIMMLRDRDWEIETIWKVSNGKRFGVYKLIKN